MEGCIFNDGDGDTWMWDDSNIPPGVRHLVGKIGVSWSFSLECFSWKHPIELASDVHRPCPPFAKENTF
jgi:hypothetical protein